MNVSLLNRFQGCLYGSILSLNINDSEDAIAVDLFLEIIKLLSDSETISLEQWQNLAQKSPEQFSFALIPLALFRHDYLASFQDELEMLTQNQLLSLDDKTALLCWSHILSLILRERFNINNLENCFSLLQSLAYKSILENYLIFIKKALHEGQPLGQIIQILNSPSLSSAIALSLYSFIDTPEDFSLIINRAHQIPHPLILPFTGAIAGAYHGLTGIPLAWRFKNDRNLAKLAFPERINQFWRQWSGVLSENSPPSSMAIASPLVIQRRSDLRLISQGDYFK